MILCIDIGNHSVVIVDNKVNNIDDIGDLIKYLLSKKQVND
jgi:hypothetical protein